MYALLVTLRPVDGSTAGLTFGDMLRPAQKVVWIEIDSDLQIFNQRIKTDLEMFNEFNQNKDDFCLVDK